MDLNEHMGKHPHLLTESILMLPVAPEEHLHGHSGSHGHSLYFLMGRQK